MYFSAELQGKNSVTSTDSANRRPKTAGTLQDIVARQLVGNEPTARTHALTFWFLRFLLECARLGAHALAGAVDPDVHDLHAIALIQIHEAIRDALVQLLVRRHVVG